MKRIDSFVHGTTQKADASWAINVAVRQMHRFVRNAILEDYALLAKSGRFQSGDRERTHNGITTYSESIVRRQHHV
jgi:hypothetical protein